MIKKQIKNYNKAFQELAEEFYRVYYNDGEEIEEYYKKIDIRTVGSYTNRPDVVSIYDECWEIGDIRVALFNKIDKEILFKWYDYQLEHHMKEKEGNPINLYSYNKQYGKRMLSQPQKIIEIIVRYVIGI